MTEEPRITPVAAAAWLTIVSFAAVGMVTTTKKLVTVIKNRTSNN